MSSCSPAATNSTAGSAAIRVASPTSTRARRRHRLEPGRGVHEVARDHALALGPDGDRGLARQDADPDVEFDAGLPAERRDHVDEFEGGTDRSLGVVLVGDRGTPQRHDGIADELLDGTAVAIDDHPGALEISILQLAHGLGIAARGERREADQVGEEDRDDRRSVAGRLHPCSVPSSSGAAVHDAWTRRQARAAGPAELRARNDRGAAHRARAEREATFEAEAATGRCWPWSRPGR